MPLDPEDWTFDVATSHHDAVKVGVIVQRWSRVHVSRAQFPDWRTASEVAGCMAVGIHGGMPTSILAVY